jgi:hypothetical protein
VTSNPLSLPTAPTSVTPPADRQVPVSATKIKPEEQAAVTALDQIARTMAKSNSAQLLQALNGLVSSNGRVATSQSGTTPYLTLINCTGNAVKQGTRDAVALLRNECAHEYFDFFPDCVRTGQPTTACAVMALQASRLAIEGFETYCVGKTKEEQTSMGCL